MVLYQVISPLFFNGVFDWLKTWSQTLAAFGSLFTFFVIIIYVRQTRLLREQTDAMKAGYTPVLLAHSVDIVDEMPYDELPFDGNSQNADGDFIKIELSNIGNEVAQSLQLKTIVEDTNRRCGQKKRVTSATSPFTRTKNPSQVSAANGGVLASDERDAEFVAEIYLTLRSKNKYHFRNCISSDMNNHRIKLGLELQYMNSAEENYKLPLDICVEFTPSEGANITSFQQVYDEARSSCSSDIQADICDLDILSS